MSAMTERVTQFETVQLEAKELFRKKNTDYGDAFATYGTVGVLVRLGDKIKRFQNITSKSVTLVEDEKVRDTLMDLYNYAAMAIMLLDENKESTGVVLEANTPVVQTWSIEGSRGYCYDRQCFVDETGTQVHTCSCPSFQYCKKAKKTCKHIDQN